MDTLLKAQLEAAEQISNFMLGIPIDLFGKPDFFIGIKRDIMWDNRGNPFGKYDLVVPDTYNAQFSVLTALITKTTYHVCTHTKLHNDNVKTTINSIKNKLEAYFGMMGLVENIKYFNF